MYNKEVDNLITAYREDFTPDVSRGLDQLHRRIEPGRVRRLPPRRRRRWLSVAATLLLALAGGFAWYLSSGTTEILAARSGGPTEITLPDGTEVTLQQGSSISFGRDFNEADRRIDLDGQGYFRVVPDPERPFLVANRQSTLRVTGTAFNLRVAAGEMEVEVSEGSVLLERASESVPVAARECGLARPGESIQHRTAPNLNRHAWRTGELTFQGTPLREVLNYLKTNWDIETSFAGGISCNYPVSGHYVGGDAGAVLADVAKLGGLQLRSLNDEGTAFEFSGNCGE